MYYIIEILFPNFSQLTTGTTGNIIMRQERQDYGPPLWEKKGGGGYEVLANRRLILVTVKLYIDMWWVAHWLHGLIFPSVIFLSCFLRA